MRAARLYLENCDRNDRTDCHTVRCFHHRLHIFACLALPAATHGRKPDPKASRSTCLARVRIRTRPKSHARPTPEPKAYRSPRLARARIRTVSRSRLRPTQAWTQVRSTGEPATSRRRAEALHQEALVDGDTRSPEPSPSPGRRRAAACASRKELRNELEGACSPSEWKRAWNDELSRRIAQIEAGDIELVEGDEVLADLRRDMVT
jgi:hypothetical protein